MSLKRKSTTFDAMPSSPFAPTSGDWDMTDSSKHLHSRTRKRFRDGRPSDEAVYAKTLRWIFSAQQQQNATAMDACDESMDSETTFDASTEIVDPRQQTLHRFFQPRAQPAIPFKPSREALAPRANETALDQGAIMQREAFERMNSVGSSNGSETMSPGLNQMDVDMDMDMDTDASSAGSNTANMGALGWM
ncbi:hypothetical protein N7532_003806 [Penicillium argentinense]|uniref:Uncharacterized protein n=1 Tax=Penicillium argentinense TaxID=1131581 RepID=A0A9W9KFJ0_9EURO|nr:uncharacterized protein N7532_003806 [Penicillium argentinense]KAJ5103277.1 hypothetical protein N7532_003806 [Penicillium argentinense]